MFIVGITLFWASRCCRRCLQNLRVSGDLSSIIMAPRGLATFFSMMIVGRSAARSTRAS